MNELALFAGGGGGILGGELLGWRTRCAVEIDPYCRSVLLARQRDGMLPPFPIWGDVRTFEGTQWRGSIDVITGGFPCQGVSSANPTAKGLDDPRSGLWAEMARIISEVGPRYVFVENSPLLVSRGLDRVLSDLAALGFDAVWGVIGAHHVGAPMRRRRIWILAYSDSNETVGPRSDERDALERRGSLSGRDKEEHGSRSIPGTPWPPGPRDVGTIPRVVDGMADGLDSCRSAIGNGQVPAVAAFAFNYLVEKLNNER